MPKPPIPLMEVVWPLLGVIAAIVGLVFAIVHIRSWLRENEGPTASEHELLTQYREMFQRGELSEEEFRFIKGRLVAKIGGAAIVPPANESTPAADQKD